MAELFSKLNWRAMWMATGAMIVPALVLIILEWIRLGSSPESLSRLSIVLLLVKYCGGLGLLIANGALYGWLAQRSGRSPVDLGSMALGGAVSALIVGVILGLSNAVIRFVQNQLTGFNSPSNSLLSSMIQNMVLAVCPGFLLYATLGAAGGTIFAVIARNRPVPAQEAAAPGMPARRRIPVWGCVAGGGLLLVIGCLVAGGWFLATDPGKSIAGGAGTLRTTPTDSPRPADLKGRIVFSSSRRDTFEIYIMNADGSGQTRLTSFPDGEDPSWSPDGKRIVFSSVASKTTIYIYVMNADGSGLTRLTADGQDNLRPAWSSDGKQIAFVSKRDGNQEIYLMNADGSNQTNLTHDPAHEEDPAWSPDGKQIAFTSNRDGNWEIYLMNPDGSSLINLTHDPASESGPAWSPDGKQIAFASNRDGNNEIYLMNTDGSGLIRLTHDPFDDSAPAWSPDGKWIAFNSNRSTWNAVIYVMRADGTDLIRLTNTESGDSSPVWIAK